MTPMRLDTILANLPDDEERHQLLHRIWCALTYDEQLDAITHLWDRRRLGATIGFVVAEVVREYQAEVAQIDAEIAAAEVDRG